MICRNRLGQEVEVYDNPTGILRFLYDCAAGKPLKNCLINPCLSKIVGKILDKRISKPLIKMFIKKSRLDMSDYEETTYQNYNAFFSRQMKSGMRPIDQDPEVIIAPCDSKVSVYNIEEDSHFSIKGFDYTMEKLLNDKELGDKYLGGTLLLFRLTVDDYHRYCYIADGQESMRTMITGVLHTVNPFVAARTPLYSENNRSYSVLRTENAGEVLMMEIGALLVGRIINHPIKTQVKRGEEKGYFQFGASSIILCFQKDAVQIDEDLIQNTNDGFETIVKMGEKIGLRGLCL